MKIKNLILAHLAASYVTMLFTIFFVIPSVMTVYNTPTVFMGFLLGPIIVPILLVGKAIQFALMSHLNLPLVYSWMLYLATATLVYAKPWDRRNQRDVK